MEIIDPARWSFAEISVKSPSVNLTISPDGRFNLAELLATLARKPQEVAADERIDLGLPITGNMDDLQFSYGAIVWKAIGNVLTKIVTAPFRALGSLFGLSGEKMEAIEFDPGSAKLQPPEREKLNQLAQVLAKRTQLKMTLPGGYNEEADGAALRKLALRAEIMRRAGIKTDAGESPGPLDHANPAVREARLDVYIERFGAPTFEKEIKPAVPAQAPNASAVYQRLRIQMEQNQPLAAATLTQLGAHRTTAILAAQTTAARRHEQAP